MTWIILKPISKSSAFHTEDEVEIHYFSILFQVAIGSIQLLNPLWQSEVSWNYPNKAFQNIHSVPSNNIAIQVFTLV